MKKLLPVLLLMLSGLAVQAQQKINVPAGYQVDTRIDNMGYWRLCAELGLVPVQPETRIPAPVYTGSKVISRGVLVDDSPDVPVTNTSSTQSENSTFVDPNDKAHVLNSNNSGQYPNTGNIYGANYFHSFDEGETWSGQVEGAGGSNSGDPAACINMTGRYYIGFIDNASGQSVAYSDNQGATWTVSKVANAPSGFTNMLDKNHLWVDNSPTSPYNGYLYDAWTTFGGSNDSQIGISTSSNNGVNWSTVQHISAAVNAGSHNQGVNLKTGPEGQAYAAWAIYDSWPSDEKAIGFAKSLDGGVTWQPAVRVITNIRGIRTTEVPQNMRVNAFPCMATDISNSSYRGTIYIVWTNHGVPGVNTGNDIDIYMIKSTDGGTTWSTPVKVNQDPAGQGKTHYMAWMTCDQANGMLSVIYYDNRNVNATQTETYISYSQDGGNTWTDLKVSDVAATPSPIPGLASGYMGDYLGISAYNGKVYPTWTDTRNGHAMTYISPIDLVLPAPHVVYKAHTLNDATFGNSDGKMGYGETELLDLKVENSGNMDADSVFVTLRSESPYITFEDSTEYYGFIPVGGSKTIQDAFKYTVSSNVPNNFDIEFLCMAKDATDSTTTSVFTIKAYAPDPSIISYSVNDATGNNNGRLDPGETAILSVVTKNIGPYDAEQVVSNLASDNPFVTIENAAFPIGNLAAGQQVSAQFTLHVDSSTYFGSAVTLHNQVFSLYQMDEAYFHLKIGLIVEDWETGNFQKFAWEQGGDADWSIDNVTKWEGNYSSRSGVIGDSQISELKINYNVLVDDTITFHRKVSSLPLSNDRLKFYIDNNLLGSWSGEQEWRIYSYPVLAGPHTFRWVYEKDNITNPGTSQDAAWVDYIVFPPEYKLNVALPASEQTCGATPYQLNGMAVNYDSLLWTTAGTGTFSDAKVLNPVYTPSAADVSAGNVVLTLTAWSMGIDSTSHMTLVIAPEVTANAGSDGAVCNNGTFTPEEATAENFSVLTWTTTGDGTFNDNTLLHPVYTPGPNDITAGTAELKLTATGASICPVVEDNLVLTVKTAPVVNLGADTAICSNLSVTLDATTPDAASYLWSPGGETTPVISADSTGTGIGTKQVSVIVTAENGCTGTDQVNIQFKDCTGINDLQGVGATIYPNPTPGEFVLELTSANKEVVDIRLFSAQGKQIRNLDNVSVNNSYKTRFNLSDLPQGTYFLEISKGNSRMVKKVIISR